MLGSAAFARPVRMGAVSGPYTWRNVEIVAGGFVTGILFHPTARDVLYARTDIGGAYRWDVSGKRWIPLNDQTGIDDGNLLGIESLALDPTDPRRLYAAVGMYSNNWGGNGAILRSDDQGRSWQKSSMPFKMGANEDGRSIGERLAVDPNRPNILFFGSRHNGLWKSTDRSATWARVTSFPQLPDNPGQMGVVGTGWILFDSHSGKPGAPTPTIYAGTGDPAAPLLRSTDAGATWSPLAGQPTGLVPHHGVFSSDGRTLYISYGNAPGPNNVSGGAVWKLSISTSAWTDITPQKGGFGYAGLAVDGAHPDTVVVSTLDRWNPGDTLFRTTDGGKSWKDIKPLAERDATLSPYLSWGRPGPVQLGHWIGALAVDPYRPGHALYGTGATIWATDDLTKADSDHPTHWRVGAEGLEETAVNDLVSPPSGSAHLLSALGDIGGFRHDDLNLSPRGGMYQTPNFNTTTSLDFAGLVPNIVARVGQGGAPAHGALSTDGGATWKPFPAEPEGVGRGPGMIALSADGKAIVWSPREGAPSLSGDGGASWTACAGLGRHVTVVADRVNPAKFYACENGTGAFFASTDSGRTFTLQPGGEELKSERCRLRAVPGEEGAVWLAARGAGLFRRSASGWERIAGVASADAVGFGKAAPGKTFPAAYLAGRLITGQAGVFRSDDAGATWVRINDDAHQYGWIGDAITGDPRIYGRVYLGTNGRGILIGEPAERTVWKSGEARQGR